MAPLSDVIGMWESMRILSRVSIVVWEQGSISLAMCGRLDKSPANSHATLRHSLRGPLLAMCGSVPNFGRCGCAWVHQSVVQPPVVIICGNQVWFPYAAYAGAIWLLLLSCAGAKCSRICSFLREPCKCFMCGSFCSRIVLIRESSELLSRVSS